MSLNWADCLAVESIPGKVSGAWLLKGTRMPVATIFANLEVGANVEEIADWYDVPSPIIKTVIAFAGQSASALEN